MSEIKEKQLDSEMDMSLDLDLLKGDDGVSYFMTDTSDLNRDFFKKYVSGKKFLDVGSGDGRIVLLALSCGANSFGIELNKNFVKMSKCLRRIKRGNFLDIDFSKYNCLFYTLRSNVNEDIDFELIEKWRDFEGTLIIYYRKTPYRLKKIEEAILSVGFTKIDSRTYITVYSKRLKGVKKMGKEKTETEKKEISFGVQMRLAKSKNEYITNTINGRYHLARCNMIAVQIQNKKIIENIDGCLKSEEFLRSEYALSKMRAIMSMRNAHFAKKELLKDFNLKKEDILALEEDYYDGKIIRESYDESYRKGNKAEFVGSSKD